jgi:UDP-2-acetamido-2,6-beta-L-arabino-hexul-4-ose reductase
VDDPPSVLEDGLARAGTVFHLAGVNRPPDPAQFESGNAGLTAEWCERLAVRRRAPKLILASSVQAALDNPYGCSKRGAEDALQRYAARTGAEAVVYRLKNLFGKWCRPNYNSVTATFCHSVAHGLPLQISDAANVVDLTYIDDVVEAFAAETGAPPAEPRFRFAPELPSRRVTLGELAGLVRSFRAQRTSLLLPDLADRFVQRLYATYLTYLDPADCAYDLQVRRDERGSLAEFLKTAGAGQIFVSTTRPGVTRGNHYHDTKTEKFLVLQGEALIRLRRIDDRAVSEIRVRGTEGRVVDIPPGCTHSIANTGGGELVTLFWASEVFDPQRPDTYREEV